MAKCIRNGCKKNIAKDSFAKQQKLCSYHFKRKNTACAKQVDNIKPTLCQYCNKSLAQTRNIKYCSKECKDKDATIYFNEDIKKITRTVEWKMLTNLLRNYPHGLGMLKSPDDIIELYRNVSVQRDYEKIHEDYRFKNKGILKTDLMFLSPHNKNVQDNSTTSKIIRTPCNIWSETKHSSNNQNSVATVLKNSLLRTLLKYHSEKDIIYLFQEIKEKHLKIKDGLYFQELKKKRLSILNKKNQPTIFIRLMSSNACIEYKYLYSCLNSYSDLIQTLYFHLVIHLDLLAIVIFHELTNPQPPEFLDYFINKIRICQNKNNSKERLDENVMEEIDSILIDINNRILKYIKSHINDNFKEEESEEFFKQYFYHISKSD